MTEEQINEIVQIDEAIKNCYLNAIERTDADREYREGQRKIAKWLEELKRHKENEHCQKETIERLQKQLDEKCDKCITRDRAEATKEFVNEYKDHVKSFTGMFSPQLGFAVSLDAVLNAVDFVCEKMTKEMVGDENGIKEQNH